MKKFFIIPVIILLCLVSCGKDDIIGDGGNDKIETPYLKDSDLYGVWTVSGNNGLYFIYFTETGRYALCFNSNLMSAGTYSLEKNVLTLTNGYLYTKDVLSIEKNGNVLKFSGDMYNFKSSTKQVVNINALKVNKEIPAPKTGETFKTTGLNAYYGSVITYIKYQSDYMINYQYCKDNSLKTLIKEEFWYYVYYDGRTYTQNCNGSGDITIYALTSNLAPLSTQIVNQ